MRVFSSVPKPCDRLSGFYELAARPTFVAFRIRSASNWGLYPGRLVGGAGGGGGIDTPKKRGPPLGGAGGAPNDCGAGG